MVPMFSERSGANFAERIGTNFCRENWCGCADMDRSLLFIDSYSSKEGGLSKWPQTRSVQHLPVGQGKEEHKVVGAAG